jgi:hypothetical protein
MAHPLHAVMLLAALAGCANLQPLPGTERDALLVEPGWAELTHADGAVTRGWLSEVTPSAYRLREGTAIIEVPRDTVVQAKTAGARQPRGRRPMDMRLYLLLYFTIGPVAGVVLLGLLWALAIAL